TKRTTRFSPRRSARRAMSEAPPVDLAPRLLSKSARRVPEMRDSPHFGDVLRIRLLPPILHLAPLRRGGARPVPGWVCAPGRPGRRAERKRGVGGDPRRPRCRGRCRASRGGVCAEKRNLRGTAALAIRSHYTSRARESLSPVGSAGSFFGKGTPGG